MKILLTGVSSFTGSWFARELAAVGHTVIAPLRSALASYEPSRRRRLEAAKNAVQLHEQAPFGSDAFLRIMREAGGIDIFCHHAADVTNYRSPDFDVHAAVRNNTQNLVPVLRALQAGNSRVGVIATGSVFESDEGAGDLPLRAFSPYGLSKALTWQVLKHHCGALNVPVGKFVITNPFGPYEEPRFTAYLIRTWKEGKTAGVKTPDYVRDNIPVDLLARSYVAFIAQAARRGTDWGRIAPSGYIESQGAFAQRFAREMQSRLGYACGLDLAIQADFSEPMVRIGTDPAARLVPDWREAAAWDGLAEFYR